MTCANPSGWRQPEGPADMDIKVTIRKVWSLR